MRYDAESIRDEFGTRFHLIESLIELHETPCGTKQQFLYCYWGAVNLRATPDNRCGSRVHLDAVMEPVQLFTCLQGVLVSIISTMKLRSPFFAIAALVALLGTPSLSCFVPRQLLDANDSDCCRHMGDKCGSETMPSSQSCCTAPNQESQPYIGSVAHPGPAAIAVVGILPISPALLPPTRNRNSMLAEFYSPPLSPPKANAILRI